MKAIGEIKMCSKCRLWRNISCYNKDAKKSDGLKIQCRDCCKQYSKAYYITHKAEEHERHKRFVKSNNDKMRIYAKMRREKFGDKIRQQRRARHKINPIYSERACVRQAQTLEVYRQFHGPLNCGLDGLKHAVKVGAEIIRQLKQMEKTHAGT